MASSACQLELLRYKGSLRFETEHQLNAQPLRIGLLVVKKDPDLHIDLDIAAAFRGHNILEFKSEQDGLSLDDLCKVVEYGCLYKAYGTQEGPVDLADVTLTLVRRKRPKKLFCDLDSHGYEVRPTLRGIYQVEGLMFPTQVVVTGELDPESHVWLASLASDLETAQVKRLLLAAATLEDERDRMLADSVMDVVTAANYEAIEEVLEEEDDMYKTLRDLMGPRFEKELAQARLEAATEAAAGTSIKGVERGFEMATRDTVERLLHRGSFSNAEIAEIAGTTEAQVRQIADSLSPAIA